MSTTHEGGNTRVDDPYVEERGGVLYIRGTRVPVESLVYLWREGKSPEAIQESYPAVTLAQVYGGIAYYLIHRAEVDRQLAEGLVAFEAQAQAAEAADPERYAAFYRRLAEARARRQAAPPTSAPSAVP